MMHLLLSRAQRPIAFATQLGLVAGSYVLAFALRFEFSNLPDYNEGMLKSLLIALAVKGVFLSLFGLYQGWWRYSGMTELQDIFKASTTGQLVFFAIVFPLFGRDDVPASIYLIDWGGNILLLGGARFGLRLYRENFPFTKLRPQKRTLIVGAGMAGGLIRRAMRANPTFNARPVGFIDDDPAKHGVKIHGLRVLGTCQDIPKVVEKYKVSEIVIAIPSATSKQMRGIVEQCRKAGVPFKTVPSLIDIVSGKVQVSQLREVDLEDLLGREQVPPDTQLLEAGLGGKVLLVTGAAGSIGSELVRQCLQFRPRLVVLADRWEGGLFDLQSELTRNLQGTSFVVEVADVTDKAKVDALFAQHQPHMVFHAAAYKHVPLMESNPEAAVKNNVFGTKVVVDAACHHSVEKFVLVSTDKAVNPTSVMGATKRIAELYVTMANGSSPCKFLAVRFGNVLGSNGSVVPIFRQQIAAGGPVTVTHAEAKRYFMSIREAAQLILHAAVMGQGGEIFILDMGEPVRILDMAKELIALSGLKPEEDIPITFVGLRPGEKLYEELAAPGQRLETTSHPKVRVLREPPVRAQELQTALGELERLVRGSDAGLIRAKLQQLVPEYARLPPRA